MAGYADTRELIINTLMGRPAGTEIQPEDHQAFALQITEYIRQVELVAGSGVPVAFAEPDTVPVQPDNGQAVYLSYVPRSVTKNFVNFINQSGNSISVTSSSGEVKLVTLLWNGSYWSSQIVTIDVLSDDSSVNTSNIGASDYILFSTSSNYSIGDIVRYDGKLYKFTTEHAAGAWNGTDVELASINSILTGKLSELFNDVDNVKTDVVALERDLGQYAELPSVAMTADTTGKYINADGEFVDDADFNIAAIGAVVVGNTYELYMGSAAKMKLGVALFVARIKTTTTSGTERIEYVPLFSAMSTDIPTSGYVCFEAMDAYSDVLVCYRADVPEAATLLVRRYGTKASIATQINNLRKKVDLKSFADGYYESMRVGTADNLTSKGDATEEVIMSRRAGGDNQIEDGSASIKRIKGYSVVKNQWCIEKEDKESVNTTGTAWSLCTLKTKIPEAADGHYYLVTVLAKGAESIYYSLSLGNNGGIKVDISPTYKLISAIIKRDKTDSSILLYDVTGSGEQSSIKRGQAIDLTQMFGSGNEPSTPEDFAKRLGYSSINDVPYIPYNEGEIVSSFAEGIKTTDTEGKVSERKWSETLKKYFPDGLKSAGSAYDEITPTKAVKRVSSARLIDFIWQKYTIESTGLTFFWGRIPGGKQGVALCDKYPTRNALDITTESDCYITTGGYIGEIAKIIIVDQSFASLDEFRNARKDSIIQYVLESPEEYTYDELNLTEQVSEGGTEEAIITEGKVSTPLRADIVYPIDAYNTIKANKANIGTLSSLNTASKTDLVSAINETFEAANTAQSDGRKGSYMRTLYEAEGAKFNEATGYYELNGLTDITEEQMAQIYNDSMRFPKNSPYIAGCYSESNARTLFRPVSSAIISSNKSICYETFAFSKNLEYIAVAPDNAGRVCSSLVYTFGFLDKLRKIDFPMNAADDQFNNTFKDCKLLEHVLISEFHGGKLSFIDSPRLNYTSLRWLVDKATNTTAVTVTVHATTYGYLTGTTPPSEQVGGTSEQWTQLMADAAARNISFATA